MKKTTITCDACGKDLSDSGAMPSYRIAVQSERNTQSGDMTYAVLVHNPLPEPLHFCHEQCLKNFIVKNWTGLQ